MRCTVKFTDNPNKEYYAGNTINGRLIVNLSRERLVKNLSIQIHGQARMKFKDRKNRDEFVRVKIVKENHLVVPSVKLPAGEHAFPFELNLPSECPPSFESKGAKIRYNAILIIPCMFLDKKTFFSFDIISNVPMPFFPANIPIRIEKRPSNSTSDCPKRYFKRGECILVEINTLKAKSRTIDMHLMQYIGYKSKGEFLGIRNEEEKKRKIQELSYQVSDLQVQLRFLVPTDIPTTFKYLNEVITVNYVFKIYVDGEKFKFPLVIGDVYQQPLVPYVDAEQNNVVPFSKMD